MTEVVEYLPDLVGQPGVAELMSQPLNTVRSWRSRKDYDHLPAPDVVISGTPFWIKQRWTDPDKPLPKLPRLLGVRDVASLFDVDADTVHAWYQRDNGAPDPIVKVGRVRIWTVPPWREFARATGRPINLAVLNDPNST